MQKILCAAIWIANKNTYVHQPNNIHEGIVFCGRRHHNCYALIAQTHLRNEAIAEKYPIVEGFITTDNIFVDRILAGKIAYNAGQISELKERLISEDLY